MALLCLMSFFRNRNWRLRFERSIVSRSSSVMSPKPVNTMFFTAFPPSRAQAQQYLNPQQRHKNTCTLIRTEFTANPARADKEDLRL